MDATAKSLSVDRLPLNPSIELNHGIREQLPAILLLLNG
jgi:hypothetical protein